MSDSRFSDVTALLPLDGANASTTITDESDTGSTDWGFTNGGEISTTQSKFGGSSARIVTDSFLEYATLAGTNHLFDPTGAFTFETWVRLDAVGAAQTIFISGGLWFGVNASNQLEFTADTSAAATIATDTSTGTLSATTWHYVEISRDASGDWRIFLDGTLEGTVSESAGDVDKQEQIQIGRRAGFSGLEPLTGYVDDLRITEGAPRNTSSYTAPTTAHPLFSGGGAFIQVDSPLTAPSLLSTWEQIRRTNISVPSILIGRVSINPINPPEFVVSRKDFLSTRIQVPGPLTAPFSAVINDFLSLIESTTDYYVMEITGSPPMEIPISSWQATVQSGRQSFLQVVIPSGDRYTDAIAARQATEEMVVYRVATVGGNTVRSEMARSGLGTVQTNSGSVRYTLTVRGYTESFTLANPSKVVPLQGIRTFSASSGGAVSIRCSIDWLLRPGQTASASSGNFVVGYINYFVPSNGDAYMDVGTRSG